MSQPKDNSPTGPSAEAFHRMQAANRKVIKEGREAFAQMEPEEQPKWDSYYARVVEMDRLFRTGKPDNLRLVSEMMEELTLEMQVDMAAATNGPKERLIRFTDQMVRRMEEKKFEMSQAQRDDLEELLQPYIDGIREQMLSELPMETRRKLEEENRRAIEGE